MNDYPKIIDTNPNHGFINVIIEGQNYNIQASNPLFKDALNCIAKNDYEAFIDLVNPASKLSKIYASYENVEVKNGCLYVFGEEVNGVVVQRILDMLVIGIDCTHIFKFILKLNKNPSKRAVDELYTFIEHKHLPITTNGNFLAYKAVRHDYSDKHTGKFFNTIDAVLEMPRNKVDDDKEVPCSHGFHASTYEYASNFAGGNDRLVLVEIDPADVVSIPVDCKFQKLRTCRYKVVQEFDRPLSEPVYETRFNTENDEDDLWEDDEEELPFCSDCREASYGNCDECDCCEGCCDCGDDDSEGCIYEGHPDAPNIEVQLQLNLDNKMQEDDWKVRRFEYIKMLNMLYSNRRPAVANAMRNFYKSTGHQHLISPEFKVLLNFTSDEDAHKIYLEYTSQ